MILRRNSYTAQEYTRVGRLFFLIGIFASQVADGRLIGAFFVNILPDKSSLELIQSVAAGSSTVIFCAAIFFHLHGLSILRSR
jgi:hypothetical protein